MTSTLRVLAYHRVLDPVDALDSDPGVVSATPADFERQMRHLRERYNVVSLEDVLAAQRGLGLPEDAVLLTFDDACRDFADVVWPILRRFDLPAVVCVPTTYATAHQPSFWWDRLHRAFTRTNRIEVDVPGLRRFPLLGPSARRNAVRSVQRHVKSIPDRDATALVDLLCRELAVEDRETAPVLNWAELRTLAAAGVTLIAHTRRHPALTQLDDTELRTEIAGSLDDLARETGSKLPAFCYPYGIHDDRVVATLRALGVEIAFTCEDGHARLPSAEPLRCPRTSVSRPTSPLTFALRLHRAGAYIDRWRHRFA